TVENKVVALPAGVRIAIAIDQEQHPVLAFGRRDRLAGADVEVEVRVIARYLQHVKIVPPGRVNIRPRAAPPWMIAMRRILHIVQKLRPDLVPLPEAAVYADRLRSGGFGTRAHALEAADVGDHLVVVAVAMPAPHRLDVPA